MEVSGDYGDICSSNWTAIDNGLINESFIDNFILEEEEENEKGVKMTNFHVIASKNSKDLTVAKFYSLEEAENFFFSVKGVYDNLLKMNLRIEEVKE